MTKRYTYTILAAAFIAAVTLLPPPHSTTPLPALPGLDKVVHFVLFGFLAAISWWETSRAKACSHAPLSTLWPTQITVAAYGALIEICQSAFTTTRTGDWADWLADVAGIAILPLLLWPLINRFLPTDAIRLHATLRPAKSLRNLYIDSFPPEERRPWHNICHLTASSSQFTFFEIYWQGKLAGFITTWQLPSATYIEHFAIMPSLRGKNIGSRALAKLCSLSRSAIVLEAELPESSNMAMRRIAFYTRAGFNAHPEFNYVQPPYSPGLPAVPLMLMTYGLSTDLQIIAGEIHSKVYSA